MTEERIIAYLLEELPEEELERFEEQCFAHEDWPVEVNVVEEDLIEDYLRDALAPERRLRFERNYLKTAARMERVRRAAALLRHLDEYPPAALATAVAPTPPEQTRAGRFRSFWGGSTWLPRVAVALVVTVAVVPSVWWLLFQRGIQAPRTVVTLALNVGNIDRSGGAPPGRVSLTRDTDTLKINLTLLDPPAQSVRYRVELSDVNGEIKTSEIVGQDAQSVLVLVPAAQLTRGQYALKLFAVRADGTERPVGTSLFIVG
jgi:hypothetical protein